jgi:hypothetical protein
MLLSLCLMPQFGLQCKRSRWLAVEATGGEGVMYGRQRFKTEACTTDAANRQTLSLAGLAVTLAVLVASVYLVQRLSHTTRVEDCLMANRLNCDRVASALQ